MVHKLPNGVICPLVTPLKKGDILDEAALDRLIEHVGQGADALLLGDLIWGEGLVLNGHTKLALCCSALEIVQGRWPLFMTITSESGEASRDLLVRIEDFVARLDYTGSIFWFDYPLYYHSNRGLPQWYLSLARGSEHGFILGNHPEIVEKRKKTIGRKNIRTHVLKKLSHLEPVKAVVFTGSLNRSMNYHRAVGHRRDFKFYDGDERAFITRPSSAGVMAGGANLKPNAWRQIVQSCLNQSDFHRGDSGYPELLSTAAMLEDLVTLYERNPAGIMKRMLHVAGLLPHAGTASATQTSSAQQNRSVEMLFSKYGMA